MKISVHKTKVKLDRNILSNLVVEAKNNFNSCNDPKCLTKQGRSLFSTYNNMNHMYERFFPTNSMFETSSHQLVVDVVGENEPFSCARVCYKPSFTSMPAVFRKAILPLSDNNCFLFFDLKSAEFFLSCLFAGETSVIDSYRRGEDIYDNLKCFFPVGTPRSVYKTVLLAYNYGGTSYTTAKRLGISEGQADRLHATVKFALPKLEIFKDKIIKAAAYNGYYQYPVNFEQSLFINVPYKELHSTKEVGFSQNLALSVYTQSALGSFMANIIKKVETELGVPGTLLTVYDSVLYECNPRDLDLAKSFFVEAFEPFRIDEFKTGFSFYEAYK